MILDDFRGITVNVMASKIFEYSICSYFDSLKTSDRQFGFKKGSGCNHAINQVRSTINLFTNKGSTVNLGFVDIRRAFDRTNFWGILNLLQKNCINPQIIDVIEH